MMGHRFGRVAAVLATVGMTAAAAGCSGSRSGPAEPVAPFPGVALRVAVAGEPGLVGMIDDRRGEWERTRGGTLSVSALEDEFDPAALADRADLIVFPGHLLGTLIDADALRTLPDSLVSDRPRDGAGADPSAGPGSDPPPGPGEELAFDQVFPPYQDGVISYGGERVALPLGGSTLVLVYRVEALTNDAIVAEAESAGVSLEPPATWEGLDALARFLHGKDWDGDGQPEAGIALALGPDEAGRLGVDTLLARSAALGLHRDYFSLLFDPDSMEARIATPPFVEALDALASLADAGPEGMETFDAQDARLAFRDGAVALLIDRAERFSSWLGPEDEAELGIARLPGSDRMFEALRVDYDPADPPNRPGYLPDGGGWLIGVSAAAERPDAAEDFARYLIEPDTAGRLRADPRVPMLPVRSPLIGQGPPLGREMPGLSRRDWSDAVSRTMLADRHLIGLRIPGASGYLDDLAGALTAASSGSSSAADALRSAAESWDGRSRSLGLDRQKWHYRRSLNSLSTSAEPPPRRPSDSASP